MSALMILLLGASVIAGCRLYNKGIVIEITQQELQEKLAKEFPISRTYLVVLKLTLSDPEVVLKDGSDRIGFGVSAATNIEIDGKDLEGKARLSAGVRYHRDQGALVLADPRVEELAVSLLPVKYQDELLAAADLATAEFLQDYAIYKLKPADFKQRLAKLVLQGVVVEDGVLKVKLGVGE